MIDFSALTSSEAGRFFVIAGPCIIEDEESPFEIASNIRAICNGLDLPFIFKASYKKANRSRRDSFTGIGDMAGLKILDRIRKEFDIPVITDVHTAEEASVAARYTDMLQIPAFLCRQTDLLLAAAETNLPVNIKKGQFMSAEAMYFAVQKVRESGNNKVLLTERGTTFGYHDLVVDFRSIPVMRSFGVPVALDCTHSLQQPNQSKGITGGRPDMISTLAKAGIAAGADGLFIETHPDPAKALSDGDNMLPLSQLNSLLEKLKRISQAL